MTNEKISYDLERKVIENTRNLNEYQFTVDYINNLAIKCKKNNNDDFFELITIVYHVCGISNKIKSSVKKGYSPYCSAEDFFSIFCGCIQKCVLSFVLDKGNFINFVRKNIKVMFIEERKQSMFRVTGQISENNQYKMSSIPIEEYNYSSADCCVNIDKLLMSSTLINELKKIKYGDILLYKYFSSDKPKTNKQLADYYGLTVDQIRQRIKKAIVNFRNKNSDFLIDYYYNSNEKNELTLTNAG